ncbi:MAG: LysM peptidoglycan-binding domain-containing protein [Bacteroidales bacterium]|jgi:LysM repeat protein|nr:LysM peptidoglycan-binding domain-containing protein [Bacteroidales bacterium]
MKKIAGILFLIIASYTFVFAQNGITPKGETVKIGGKIFYAHIVKKGETAYNLGKKYEITVDELVSANPSIKNGLTEGMVIYIPCKVQKKEKGKQKEEDITQFKRYTVKWYDDLQSIAQKFEVTEEALVSLNKLKTNKLARRQVLLIPDEKYMEKQSGADKKGTTDIEKANISTQKEEDNIHANETATQKDTISLYKRMFRKNPVIKTAYILPLECRDSVPANANYMDFYAGALMAIGDLKKDRISIDAEIIDQTEFSSINNLIASGKLNDRNFIIGPVDHKSYTPELLDFSRSNGIPFISPMDNAVGTYVADCSNIIQVPSDPGDVMLSTCRNALRKYYSSGAEKILLIHEKGSRDSLYFNIAARYLSENGINFETIQYGILEGRYINGDILAKLSKKGNNIVIVPSNSEAFSNDAVRNLALCMNPIETGENKAISHITLFGMPRWKNFETIDIKLFHKMNLHLSLPYYVDYNSEKTQDFIRKYRALFHSEPTPYSFSGYDITSYFVYEWYNYGINFPGMSSLPEKRMLQTDFLFKNPGEGHGLKNTGTTEIIYKPDYTISIVKPDGI